MTTLGQGSLLKTGYTFAGWNTNADGTGSYYVIDDTFPMPGAAVTLYARWTANPTYQVVYHENAATSGTVPVDTANYMAGDLAQLYGNIGLLKKTGYTFVGWNTKADGTGTAYTTEEAVTITTVNAEMYAQWTAEVQTISFDANGGTGTQMTAMIGATDSSVTLKVNEYTKTGYAFVGWATTSTGTVCYADGATTTMPANGLTLYAKWTVNKHNVVYNGNGHNGGSEPTTVACDYNATVTVSERGTMVRTGYTFLGWSETQVSDTAEYPAGMTFSMPDSVVTLYAVWKINTYNVGYDGNGYTGGTLPTGGTLDYNMPVTIPVADTMVRTGYSFLGWSETQSATTATYTAPGNFTVLDHNMTLYAVWKVNQYSVTYKSNGITTTVIPDNVSAHDYGTITTVGGSRSGNDRP